MIYQHNIKIKPIRVPRQEHMSFGYKFKHAGVGERIEMEEEGLSPYSRSRLMGSREIGGTQCNKFQNKIKLKKKENSMQFLNQYDTSVEASGQQKYIKSPRFDFAQQYRLNLRRTVFNETKLMMKSKRRLSSQFYVNESTARTEQSNRHPSEYLMKVNKVAIQKMSARNKSQQLNGSPKDSLYATIDKQHASPRFTERRELIDISKLPLIGSCKQQNNMNFSNLIASLNQIGPIDEKQHKAGTKGRLNVKRQGKAKGFRKDDLNPWETFADQFTD